MTVQQDLTVVTELIKRRCGLSFEAEKRSVLEAALRERMAATGQASVSAYFAGLVGCDREFMDLVSLLTINETYFFREPQHLALLTERLMPRLLAQPGRPLPLRVLSAGCSTGEEPYSIMMAARERYGSAVSQVLSVIGCDIDRQALARARRAIYKEFSFRGVPQPVRDRYFTPTGSDFALLPAGREGVDFMALNLLDDFHLSPPGRFDIIFLRNVSIYFDEQTRREIQRRLGTLLTEGGCLLVGMAETLANDFGLMPLVQEDGVFYFTRDTVGRPVVPSVTGGWMTTRAEIGAAPTPTPIPTPIPALAPTPTLAPSLRRDSADGAPLLEQAQRLTWERSYDRALSLLEMLTGDGERAGGVDHRVRLLKAHILLNRKAFAAAEAVAGQVLAAEPWSVDACLVLGLAARYADKPAPAVDWFKRAVYAHHGCWPAHYHLADLHRVAGDMELARAAYGVVLRLLAAEPEPETGIKVLLPAFPASDIRFLCEHQMARLGGGRPTTASLRRRVRT